MKRSKPIAVLILADPETAADWGERLAEKGVRIWLDACDVPGGVLLDLIVISQTMRRDDWSSPSRSIVEFQIGVVTVGDCEEVESDVSLPADATMREMELACRLLAEIVQLRRQSRRGQRVQKALSDLAMSDSLTGLANRRAWDAELATRIKAVCHGGPAVGMVILDLDHFKQVNDQHGHQVGDQLLRATGDSLTGSVRDQDFVARLGGDEFGVLLCEVTRDAAMAIVDRIRSAIKLKTIASTRHAVSASAGYVVCASQANSEPISVEAAVAAADSALRRAKQQGRDRTVASGEG